MQNLETILGATAGRPSRIHLSKVPARLQPHLEPLAVDGWVAIPSLQRHEKAWPQSRIPAWFHLVPGKPALKWTRPDGHVGPHYAELIVQDLLRQGGWESVWVKYWGHRRFWRGLDRHGPIEVELPVRPRALIGTIDRLVVDHTGRRPTAIPGGCWDIFAWRCGPRWLFLEVKEPGEGFSENQPAWLAASLAAGVPFESFGVVEYRY